MKIEELDYNNRYLLQALQQMPAGAFLTTRLGDKINTMTIGWGAVGFIWGHPVLIVAVRRSRHTYEIIDKSGEFTVSFPLGHNLKRELEICGTRSGRDIDKFQACTLTPQPGRKVETPVIGECLLHYECKVIYKQPMEPDLVRKDIDQRFYGNKDYHTIYYGKIVACYKQVP